VGRITIQRLWQGLVRARLPLAVIRSYPRHMDYYAVQAYDSWTIR
jgi:hypothetical protein